MEKSVNPVALVTGGARRIGAALVKTLHAHQYNVIIHYRDSKTAAEALLKECLKQRPNSAICINANLCDINQTNQLVKAAAEQWKRLDVLINNASVYYPIPLTETTTNEWNDIINSNLTAPFFLAQAGSPYLAKTKGTIINFSDSSGLLPRKNYTVYSISKAGLNMLTQSLAVELAPLVRVNAIAPGSTLWPEHGTTLKEAEKKSLITKIPLQRQTHLKDLTQTLLFLIENQQITGQIIAIDGGQSL